MDDANNASDDEEHDEQTRALRLIQPSTATPPRPTQPRPSTATPTAPTTTPPTSRAAAATPTFVHSYSQLILSDIPTINSFGLLLGPRLSRTHAFLMANQIVDLGSIAQASVLKRSLSLSYLAT